MLLTSCITEGVDVRDEADEGTNAIDIDSLPRLPALQAPQAPQPPRQTFVQVGFPSFAGLRDRQQFYFPLVMASG